jgi:type IV secretory pathway VirB6-like protein
MKRFTMLALGTALSIALAVPAWSQTTTGNTPKQSTTTPKKETKEEKKARKEAERAKKKTDKDAKKGTSNPTNTSNKNNTPTK